ncbi:FAD-dependent oxidoreductase [Accumulibacter sp.]|uniref:NAD(P)/FAD-dependent oxidoreductase n=1 Tax=Accumulibacter sp. TaxID=2053492 RepID=UPI0025DF77B2|nr:FAD-dependent oxidoreductase [Accumulibacter sp.]
MADDMEIRGGQRIAVIGAGISGLASAWLLSQRHRVTLYEAGETLGGHTNTVDVTLDGECHPVDTGFLVYNTHTYPNLTAMFAHLGVASVETEMSFSVSLEEPRLEWAGSSLATVFGQKRNLLRPDFWRMLSDIVRFNRDSVAWLDASPQDQLSLRDYLAAGAYSRAFAEWYLLPMAAAIWSCPAGQMLDYPLASFVRFCRNHGLLQVLDRPLWRTVRGGGREYVRKLAAGLDDVRLATPVRGIRRAASGLLVRTDEAVERHDQVVLACHSDQALSLLGGGATIDERCLLGAIRYAPNRAVLHTDAALLPRSPALWSAWNYLSSGGPLDQRPVSVSYLINRLQPLPFKTPLMVSLNPRRAPAGERVIAEFDYQHPIFDAAAIAAQRRLSAISGAFGVWFCGAWNGYGFHEDGLKSALRVANALACHAPWQGVDEAAVAGPALRRAAELAA